MLKSIWRFDDWKYQKYSNYINLFKKNHYFNYFNYSLKFCQLNNAKIFQIEWNSLWKIMKIFLVHQFLLFYLISYSETQRRGSSYSVCIFKSLECSTSDETLNKWVYSNYSCYVKVWKKKIATGNVYAVPRMPMDVVYVRK